MCLASGVVGRKLPYLFDQFDFMSKRAGKWFFCLWLIVLKLQVVCAAVVVLKRLLHAEAPVALLKRVVKLIDSIKAPPARACVIWLICTHIENVCSEY